MRLHDLYRLARRYVPAVAVDPRLVDRGSRSWWPAHEIGHFLVATPKECQQPRFGLDDHTFADGFIDRKSPREIRYVIVSEVAAMSISQRLLRRAGHHQLADEEIEVTDETTLDCRIDPWCKRAVRQLLRKRKVTRLPTAARDLERLLERKTRLLAG